MNGACDTCWDMPCRCGTKYRKYSSSSRLQLIASALDITGDIKLTETMLDTEAKIALEVVRAAVIATIGKKPSEVQKPE